MYRYYKYSYASNKEKDDKCQQEAKMGKTPSPECLQKFKNIECTGLNGLLNAKCRGNPQQPSRPYKQAQPIKSNEQKQKEKDEDRQDKMNRGELVSQVTPGKLKKNPDILATLLQQIFDFFKNITNPPTPIQKVMEKYPAPPYTTTTVPPRVTTS